MKESPFSIQWLLSQPTLQERKSLAELPVARLVISNKRHGNDSSKSQMHHFSERPRWAKISMEEMSLSNHLR